MWQQKARFDELGIIVLSITFEIQANARIFAAQAVSGWPLLLDESHQAYRYYGLCRVSFFDLWNPSTLWLYFLELLHGRIPHLAHGDIYQRGGDMLIDPEGTVRLYHIGAGPADRPAVETILKVVAPDICVRPEERQ